MSLRIRVFLDVSYTRMHPGNVGITRTVRRLQDGMKATSGCLPIVFHRSGYRQLAGPTQLAMTRADADRRIVARIFRWLNNGTTRRLVSMLPLAILRPAWAVTTERMFNAMGARELPLVFQPGDVLVLADESWNYPAWNAAQIARRQGAAVVLMVHDLIPLRHPEFCAPLFTDVFRRWLQRMLAHSDAVVCNSAATRADLLRWCEEEGLPVPRSAHFRLGSDLPRGGDEGTVRPHVGRFVKAEPQFFFALGSIEPRKNYGLLLTAFERLWKEGVAVRLMIAGRPDVQCHELVHLLRHHPQQGRLLLTLFDASDAEVALAYGHCRALVFPSLAEGFGLPLVEARSRGCPVIASDLPALRELADEGVFLFPPGDGGALMALLREHAVRDHRCDVGKMPNFSWGQSASDLLDVVGRLLAPRSSG